MNKLIKNHLVVADMADLKTALDILLRNSYQVMVQRDNAEDPDSLYIIGYADDWGSQNDFSEQFALLDDEEITLIKTYRRIKDIAEHDEAAEKDERKIIELINLWRNKDDFWPQAVESKYQDDEDDTEYDERNHITTYTLPF